MIEVLYVDEENNNELNNGDVFVVKNSDGENFYVVICRDNDDSFRLLDLSDFGCWDYDDKLRTVQDAVNSLSVGSVKYIEYIPRPKTRFHDLRQLKL